MTKPSKPPEDSSQSIDVPVERVFLADDTIPNVADAFGFKVEPIDIAIKSADIVLDTNVLLLPYGAGSSSLEDIVGKFKDLSRGRRLFLPAQVAREFIRNRPNKLAELQQQLADKISKFQAIDKLNFPVLEGVEDYDALNAVLEKTVGIKKELTAANGKLLKLVRSWEWNDPVGMAYRDVFTKETIVQPTYDRAEVLRELQRRYRLQIPPGYKDASKDDLGVGDYLVWLTILEIGRRNKKPIILVSGDEKADWQHRSASGAFLPRFELLDEYRRASGGQAFYIIPFSKLLELLDAGDQLVEEIKQEEQRVQDAHNCSASCVYCGTIVSFRLAEPIGSTAQPRCPTCEKRFYAHRTRDGILCRPTPEKPNIGDYWKLARRSIMPEANVPISAACPNCGEPNETQLGVAPFSSQWCMCKRCTSSMLVQRISSGDFVVLQPTLFPRDEEDKNPDA